MNGAKTVQLLLKSLLRRSIYGKANSIPDEPKVILVVATGKLGDVVCSTPVMRALRVRYPRARIIVEDSRNGITASVLADSGLADEFIDLKRKASIKLLRKCSVDLAVFTGPDFLSLVTAYLVGIPCIITPRIIGGWSPYETRPYKILSRFMITTPFAFRGYAPRERLRVLEPLGIVADDTKKHLGFSAEASKRVNALLKKERISEDDAFVCLAPGAGNKIKQWPPERFARVAEYIWEKYRLPIVILGSKIDCTEAEEMIASLDPKVRIINTVEQIPIDDLKALISRAYLFVGVDTGPQYIAEAFDVPTIDIVGPVDEHEQPPIGERHIVVVPPGARVPQLHIMNTGMYDEAEAIRQVQATSIKQVEDAVDKLIARLDNIHD